MKHVAKKRILQYTAVFEPAPEGGYVVYVPALPGCMTQGETFEEAQRNAQDAVEGYLAASRDLEEEIPQENEGVIITRVSASAQ